MEGMKGYSTATVLYGCRHRSSIEHFPVTSTGNSHPQSHLSRTVHHSARLRSSVLRLFFLVMMPQKNLQPIHQVPSSGRRLESCSWNNDPKSGCSRDILAEWIIQGQWEADRVYHTYSELGRVGLTTSRFGSLEFILGCRLLLELGMLFALEETDSKLELMMLFLCSSEEKKRQKGPYEC